MMTKPSQSLWTAICFALALNVTPSVTMADDDEDPIEGIAIENRYDAGAGWVGLEVACPGGAIATVYQDETSSKPYCVKTPGGPSCHELFKLAVIESCGQ